jgi:hypothetical protein
MPAGRKRVPVFYEGPEAALRFGHAMGRVLSVSKEELERREAEHQESRKGQPRRGPKPTKR